MSGTKYDSPLTEAPTKSSWLARALVALALFSTSCGPGDAVTRVPADHARLRGLVTVYAYAAAELGRPPLSVDELLPVFEQASITDPSKYLTSTRDGKPYVILWGVDLAGGYAGSDSPLAYEQIGVDGERLVVTCGQQIKEVSERAFAYLAWPEGYKPEG